MSSIPIDPLTGPPFALEGRVVTMDVCSSILDRGVIYVNAGRIISVQSSSSPPPPGYDDVPIIRTGGTIYPGLIELHNHLSYNILQQWDVPKRYTNRDQWSGGKLAYRKLISGPMGVLGRIPYYVPAIVRYVECKCLLGGVTTSQGISLYSNRGINRYYHGIVRNVEETNDVNLPEAKTKISDVDAEDANKFLARLQRSSCLLLHLAEGTDEKSHKHFEALHLSNSDWAITPALAGIHSLALKPDDYQTLSEHGGSIIWSPLSNLMLYGETVEINSAKACGLVFGIGSDWSPTGSKNLLGELKVARLISEAQGNVFTDKELLAMVTCNASKILKWEQELGSIESNKRADLLVISGRSGDPYGKFLESHETGIILVIINGVPRYGRESLMKKFDFKIERCEYLKVGHAKRLLNLVQETSDPVVGALTLNEARGRLRKGLRKLPDLAFKLEHPSPETLRADAAFIETHWFLTLEHDDPPGLALRPHLPFGKQSMKTAHLPTEVDAASIPLSELLEPLNLDRLTVADDKSFLDRLLRQPNLPDYIKDRLYDLY